jgi:hypothetical protein
MLLRLWADRPYRAIRDLDLLRRGDGAAESIRADLHTICTTEVAPDGVVFDPRSIRLEAIRREDEYAGTRARLVATCGSIRMMLQVDLGVGDAAWPPPESRLYPALLDLPTDSRSPIGCDHSRNGNGILQATGRAGRRFVHPRTASMSTKASSRT